MSRDKVLSAEAAAVLAGAEVVDGGIRLPDVVLARPLYVEVNEALTRMGGKWKGGKVRAHVFGEIDPAPLLDEIRATGQMPAKNPTAFFPTPTALARRMVTLAGGSALNDEDVHILEPSAGQGAIADAIEAVAPDAQLDLVEALPTNASALRNRFLVVAETDFLAWEPEGYRYNAVLMNPPFAVAGDPLAYIAHIRRAHAMLAPGGVLVAIAPSSILFRTDKRTTAFRADVESVGTIELLPADSFAESGTSVNTALLVMRAA